jgi:transposase-like protein
MNKALFELLGGKTQTEDFLSELIRRGSERLIQELLEGEVTDHLGREYYERTEDPDDHRGYRNGYRPRRIKTAEGTLEVNKPRVRDTEEPFESQLLARIDGLEERLKQLVVEMYVRGLSTRDIEETLVDQDGESLVSRSSVSRICEQLHEEYEVFCEKDLSDLDVVYLFVDGVYEAVRDYTNNQAILCAWAICADGTKQMLHLGCVASESRDAWSAFFEEMIDRGLGQPLLVISDGAQGLIAAIQEHFPQSDRQRCLAHKLRNLTTKLPRDPELRDPVLAELKAIYYAPNREVAELLAERFIEAYAEQYPSVVKCLSDDLKACLVHLNYPQGHHRYIRTTNLLERSFQEEKRRTKVIPHHVNERGAMKLVSGVLIRTSKRWNKVKMTNLELTQLKNIRALIWPDADKTSRISLPKAA